MADGEIVIDTDLDTKGFEKNSAKMQRSITTLVKQVDRIGDIPFDSSRFSAQVNKARDSIDRLKEGMDDLSGKTISTVDYEAATKCIEQAEKALGRLYDRQALLNRLGVDKNSKQWRSLIVQIQEAARMVKLYKADRERIVKEGTAFNYAVDTSQFQELNSALQEAERRLEGFEASAQGLVREKKVEGVLDGLTNALKRVVGAAWKATSALAKLTFGKISSGAKKAVASFKSFVSESKKVNMSSKGLLKSLTSLKTMLVSRVKRMFISAIFNEMKEAMNKLTQFDSTFNTAMSNMKNSAKELSANMAVTFASLIKTIEPFVTQIVAALSTAIRYLNAFFAMLQGKSTMTVAKKQTASYADSLKDASKNAKELNRQLMGFDELNRMEDNEDSSGAGGAGAGDLFEEVPVDSQLPESVKDFFTRLRDAFKEGNWEEFGYIIAGGLNTGMKYVDNWITGTLQPLALAWTSRIARILNGLVSGLDWHLMGKTLADGFNTVFGAIHTFLTEFDFESLGKGVGDAINGVIEFADWETIGETFGAKWNALIDFIHGLVTETDWAEAGTSLMTAVDSWVGSIEWGKAGETLSAGVIGLFDAISAGFESVNWQEVGDKVSAFIQNIDWSGIFTSASHGIGAALGGLAAFIWGIIDEAWASVVTWWKEVAYEDGKFTMLGLLGGIWDVICNIYNWIKTNIFDPFMEGFNKVFQIGSPSKVMQEEGGFIVSGLLLGITEGWNKITKFFSTGLSSLKSTLSSTWSSVKTTASTAWNSVKNSISTSFTAAQSKVSTVAEEIKEGLSTAWDTISTTATTSWDTITTTLSEKWDGLQTTFSTTDWSTIGQNICSGIADGINQGWEWLKSSVENLAMSLLNSVKSVLGIHSPSRVFRDQVGLMSGLGLAEGIEDSERAVTKTVANLAQSTVDAFGNPTLSTDIVDTQIVNDLDTVANHFSRIVDAFAAICEMLSYLGELQVPQIAAGTTVPPRIKAASASAEPVETEFSGGPDFASAFDEFSEKLDALIWALEHQQFVADFGNGLRILARAVSKEQRRNLISEGG